MVEKMWEFAGMVILLALISVSIAFIVAPHKVDGYYLSRSNQGAANGVCVYAHWTWHPDELSFCTDDYAKALDFVAKANQSIH